MVGKRKIRICSIDGCHRKHYAYGFCYKHYKDFLPEISSRNGNYRRNKVKKKIKKR